MTADGDTDVADLQLARLAGAPVVSAICVTPRGALTRAPSTTGGTLSSSLAGLLASEGGWQSFQLKGGEWAILWLSIAAALLAIAVGFYLMKLVLAEDEGTPKMREIALAIQEGASAYLLSLIHI